MSDEVVAFLRAQVDEDERVADDASARGTWSGSIWTKTHSAPDWTQEDPEQCPGRIVDNEGNVVVYDEGSPGESQAAHIARHDPARVLREVEADRELIAAYEEACERDPDGSDTDYASGLYVAVKLRAVAHGWTDA